MWLAGLKFGSGRRRAGEDTRPYEEGGSFRNIGRAGPRPARGRTLCAPTAENGPRALVRRRQAQKRKRTSYNFLPAQAPSGAGWDRAQALLILRAGRILPGPRDNPRKRGPGKGEYEREALI